LRNLFEYFRPEKVLSRRFNAGYKRKPWVSWFRYWNNKNDELTEGPYKNRKRIMKTLCKNAGVRYFRFHAFRHFGASLLDRALVPIGAIQRILGHENRTTTDIYLHSIGEAEREAMRIFDNEIETNPQPKIRKDLTLLS
jgi:integrase